MIAVCGIRPAHLTCFAEFCMVMSDSTLQEETGAGERENGGASGVGGKGEHKGG